jgi:hypothetical protein
MIKALVLAGDVKLLWNAERRGRTALNEDARAALIELLDRFNGTNDAELARWARDHEDAGGLRERWGRELATAAAEATAPVWKRTANFDRDAVFAETGEPWAVAKVMDRLADDTRAEVRTLFQGEPAPVHPLEWLGGYVEIEMPDEGDVPDGYQVADYRMGVAKPPGVEIALMLTDDEVRKLHPGVNPTNPADVATAVTTSLRSDIASLLADRPPPRTDAAAPVEPAAEQRWRILRPSAPPRYLLAFAFDLWRARWHDEAVEGRKRAGRVPALTTRTAALVAAVLSPATVVQHHDDRIELVGTDGRTVGKMEHEHVSAMLTSWRGPVVDASMVRANADRLVENARTAAGVAGFWHGLHTATSLSRRGLDLRAEWSSWSSWADEVAALAELKLDPNLRRLLCDFAWYGNTIQLRLFDGRWGKGLWSLVAPDPHKRGRPAAGDARAVAFRYGDVLDPGWARQENASDRNRGVHLLGLPDRLPVHVADRAAKARAQVYTLLLLVEVCERSNHEHVADGAEVSAADRLALAARSGLHHDHEPVQLRGLLDDGLLVEVRGGRNRYALGDEKARALRAHTRPTPPHQRGRR